MLGVWMISLPMQPSMSQRWLSVIRKTMFGGRDGAWPKPSVAATQPAAPTPRNRRRLSASFTMSEPRHAGGDNDSIAPAARARLKRDASQGGAWRAAFRKGTGKLPARASATGPQCSVGSAGPDRLSDQVPLVDWQCLCQGEGRPREDGKLTALGRSRIRRCAAIRGAWGSRGAFRLDHATFSDLAGWSALCNTKSIRLGRP